MTITVIRNGKEIRISGKEGCSLLELLRSRGIYVRAVCGGKGTCGKCKVRMLSGAAGISAADRKFFSGEELKAGWRLACTAYPKGDCRVMAETEEEAGFEAVAGHCKDIRPETEARQESRKAGISCAGDKFGEATDLSDNIGYDIAIDIGTTTIAMELLRSNDGERLHTVTLLNHQRGFGADVISRIRAANEGHGEELKKIIRRDLEEGIRRLLKESGVSGSSVRYIAIAGNTTMGHLLMGYSCETLGTYPFTPVNIGIIRTSVSELLGEGLIMETAEEDTTTGDIRTGGMKKNADPMTLDLDTCATFLPGISAYVGADIAAGMLACDFDRREKPCLLIDLGTNGEMAVGNRDRILVTSVAAGPAFEGGNISCGMGSVPGAICNVAICNEAVGETRFFLHTIGDQPPRGICGTGVIETTCELVKAGLVDETGMLNEACFTEGVELAKTPEGRPITFTQKDVREVQLAKSAVRAGLETLLKRYGITYEDVDQVFLAGGFGYKADPEKMAGIGMLPEEWKTKTTAIGNSSLAGAACYLTSTEAESRLKRLVEISAEIELASDRDFDELYMRYMFF